jgi:hypothetical protein
MNKFLCFALLTLAICVSCQNSSQKNSSSGTTVAGSETELSNNSNIDSSDPSKTTNEELSSNEETQELSVDYSISLSFSGPNVSPQAVYASWVEDENENNIQNIYICNSLLGIGKTLHGDAIPYWTTVKYPQNKTVDGVTGASIQKEFKIQRDLILNTKNKFKVCFEIDRSLNDNEYFNDRPSFVYKTNLIDINDLKDSYTLNLVGWMTNDTNTGTYSQAPIKDIPDYEEYKLMPDLSYIEDHGDMVNSLEVTLLKK